MEKKLNKIIFHNTHIDIHKTACNPIREETRISKTSFHNDTLF